MNESLGMSAGGTKLIPMRTRLKPVCTGLRVLHWPNLSAEGSVSSHTTDNSATLPTESDRESAVSTNFVLELSTSETLYEMFPAHGRLRTPEIRRLTFEPAGISTPRTMAISSAVSEWRVKDRLFALSPVEKIFSTPPPVTFNPT